MQTPDDPGPLRGPDGWDAAHARYQEIDDRVRAVITWIDGSREDAVAAARRTEAGRSRGPLDGVLVGLKDNIDVAGVVTTAGASFLAHNVAPADATVVRRLREAGAVVSAKLNMAELAWGATTQNLTYGACRNPWDLDRIPGGSSGGSGAALAAGYCDLALGTDTGASVRIPAALNGVVGLRPSVGSISIEGVLPAAKTQDTVGPMARRAIDAARLTEVLTGFDPADPYSVASTGAPATSAIGKPLDGLTVGVARRFFFDGLDDGVGERIETFLGWLADQGTVAADVPDFGAPDAHEHWTRIVGSEGAAYHRERLLASPDDFSPDVLGRVSAGLDVSAVDLVRSLVFRAEYRTRLAHVFTDLDVIVTPVVPVDVPAADGPDSRAQTLQLGRITYPWALHDGPTLSLPIGFHPRSGLPVGVALTAPRFGEAVLFQIACAYQDATDWHRARAVVPTR
ncbi:amidase [Pseudonocardia benzenivorans]|uniref:Amidase n=1 Tax=Pseudonocardia benzenivorans TaxID=228005 RepID=A0ABW3VN26_9PSEU|nr:glutamyl-tRNA(Gln) amidotransferase subunit A [Pseudonocardia sp. D17]